MRFFASVRIPKTPIRVGFVTDRVRCPHCGNFNWGAFWFGVFLGGVALVGLAWAVAG